MKDEKLIKYTKTTMQKPLFILPLCHRQFQQSGNKQKADHIYISAKIFRNTQAHFENFVPLRV